MHLLFIKMIKDTPYQNALKCDKIWRHGIIAVLKETTKRLTPIWSQPSLIVFFYLKAYKDSEIHTVADTSFTR